VYEVRHWSHLPETRSLKVIVSFTSSPLKPHFFPPILPFLSPSVSHFPLLVVYEQLVPPEPTCSFTTSYHFSLFPFDRFGYGKAPDQPSTPPSAIAFESRLTSLETAINTLGTHLARLSLPTHPDPSYPAPPPALEVPTIPVRNRRYAGVLAVDPQQGLRRTCDYDYVIEPPPSDRTKLQISQRLPTRSAHAWMDVCFVVIPRFRFCLSYSSLYAFPTSHT
jgi:hypothetical protein